MKTYGYKYINIYLHEWLKCMVHIPVPFVASRGLESWCQALKNVETMAPYKQARDLYIYTCVWATLG